MSKEKRYIGDGVYAQYREDGYYLVLTTEDGISVSNTIYLEPGVIQSLIEFIKDNRK